MTQNSEIIKLKSDKFYYVKIKKGFGKKKKIQLTNRDLKMALKHMKTCSTSLQ